MTIFTLVNITTYLMLSFNSPTTFVFDSPIEYISISNESDFAQYRSSNKKILTLKPFKNNFESKIVVITKKGAYPLNLKITSSATPQLYQISDGEKGNSYYTKFSNEELELLESDKIYLLRLKSKKYKMINDVPARTQQYLPKNSLIKLDSDYLTL